MTSSHLLTTALGMAALSGIVHAGNVLTNGNFTGGSTGWTLTGDTANAEWADTKGAIPGLHSTFEDGATDTQGYLWYTHNGTGFTASQSITVGNAGDCVLSGLFQQRDDDNPYPNHDHATFTLSLLDAGNAVLTPDSTSGSFPVDSSFNGSNFPDPAQTVTRSYINLPAGTYTVKYTITGGQGASDNLTFSVPDPIIAPPVVISSEFRNGAFEVTASGLISGRIYALKRSATLQDGFPVTVDTIVPTGTVATATDPAPPTPRAFYRVVEIGISTPAALEVANIQINSSQSQAVNGLIQGNGDLVSSLHTKPNKLILDLTKNDVYDARIDTSTDPDLVTINVSNHSWSRTPSLPPSWDKPFPGPVRCARVSIDFPEFMTTKLDLKRAVASINNGDVTVRSLAQSNVYEIHTTRNVTVVPVVGAGLAAPVTGQTDEVAWITQALPADATGDWPGMNFAVASAHSNNRHTIAVVGSLESAHPLQDAIALVRATQLATEQSVITIHETAWQDFWSKSSIKIADQELSNMWYQNLYFSRCVSKPGAQAVGLFAGPMLDAGGWHDNYTINYNFQQTFWGNIITNHVEMVEPLTRVFERYIPRARWFANETYGFEGAYFPHNLYRHEPVDPTTCVSNNNRMFAAGPWAYTIGNSGYALHNIWLSFKYQPDPVHLAQHVYPIVKDVGRFYINFVDRCALDGNGKAILGPSVSPEHGDLGIDNCPFDIAFVQFTLKALIEGATALGTDAALVADAQRVLGLLPPHPTSGGVVVDRQGGTPFEYNLPVPMSPVFPCEQVTWFSPPSEKALFTHTVNHISTNGNNSMMMLALARARLSTPDAMTWLKNAALARMKPNRCLNLNTTGAFNSFGNYTEQFAISGAISELLLQSVGDILRVLPAWPANLDAEFTNLRAQGGFLVSATKTGGALTALSITSTAGKPLKLLAPWNTVFVNGQPVAIDGAGIVTVHTTPGQNLTFSPD